MHHHHPPLPITGASGSTAAGAGTGAAAAEDPPTAVTTGPTQITTAVTAFLLVQQKHAHWDSLLQALLVTIRNHFSVTTPNTFNPSPNNTLHLI